MMRRQAREEISETTRATPSKSGAAPEAERRMELTKILVEQGANSAIAFLSIIVASKVLEAVAFAEFTKIYLLVGIVTVAASALVFQPLTRRAPDRSNQHFSEGAVVLGILLAVGVSGGVILVVTGDLTFSSLASASSAALAILVYELIRRRRMVERAWLRLTSSAVVTCIASPLLIMLAPPEPAVAMAMVAVAYGLGALLNSGFSFRVPSARGRMRGYREMLAFGFPLLISSIPAWFVAGGYLVVYANSIDVVSFNALRIEQNLFNGIFVLLIGLETSIFVRPGRSSSSFYANALAISGAALTFIIMAAAAARVIYPGCNSCHELALPLGAFYMLLALHRWVASILKQLGRTTVVMVLNLALALIFVVLVHIALESGATLDGLEIARRWLAAQVMITGAALAAVLLLKSRQVREDEVGLV